MRKCSSKDEADEEFEADVLVERLTELRESLRDHYKIGRTLQEGSATPFNPSSTNWRRRSATSWLAAK